MPPQIKPKDPPIFKGEEGEDALSWLERYETIGTYNGWGNEELRNNFQMCIDGNALKWYRCTNLPALWRDTPANNDVPMLPGLRTQFLQEFLQENFKFYQEEKLRSRMQGINESTTSYYYDVINLCRRVDPNMSENNKVAALYRGLKPSLMEKMYPLSIQTSAEFLAKAKIYAEAEMLMANRRN